MKIAISCGQPPDDAYRATLLKVVNDAKQSIADTMESILTGLIKPHFDSEVKPLVLKSLAPIGKLIGLAPEPIKAFMSMESITEDMLDNIVSTAIRDIVTPVAQLGAAELDALVPAGLVASLEIKAQLQVGVL